MSDEDRFWGKVSVGAPTVCWPWTAGMEADGYGRVWWQGQMTRAHRVAYLLHHGTLPQWQQRQVLDHSKALGCTPDRACCNPTHLEVVTIRENTQRGVLGARQRAYRAERERQEHVLAAASIGYPSERADLLNRGDIPPLVTYKDWLTGHAQALA